MTKNIIVVDEQGKEYGATWLKRAKGLVKNGRARFLSENRICLACPPELSEDKEMEDREYWKEEAEQEGLKEELSREELPEEPLYRAAAEQLMGVGAAELHEMAEGQRDVLSYILKQMEAIQSQTEYLNRVIDGLTAMERAGEEELFQDEAEGVFTFLCKKMDALVNVVRCRETTNQELLRLYGKMYEDTPVKAASRQKAYGLVECVVNSHLIESTDKKDIIINLFGMCRKLHIQNKRMITNLPILWKQWTPR